jgi:DNA (cytosine-5)-methyltransferase 1
VTAYYNENDPYAAQWLRNLIAAGHIAPGIVDERSIKDVEAFELMQFTQCHFFAGIGIWSHALRRAGWSDDRPIWTGSCPCQPFSAAGKQKGFEDERHLWPIWNKLIEQCKPAVVVGEQVDKALDWIDLVSSDLEAQSYAFGTAIISAAGFEGAHIRHRNYFVGLQHSESDGRQQRWSKPNERGSIVRRGDDGLADDFNARLQGRISGGKDTERENIDRHFGRSGTVNGLGNSGFKSGERGTRSVSGEETSSASAWHPDGRHDHGYPDASETDGMADACSGSITQSVGQSDSRNGDATIDAEARTTDAIMLGRQAVDWLYGRDGKWRPVEPGTFPLANAASSRVGRLRAYGNALDAETATQFCEVVREIVDGV